jgi:DNA mismatch repair protein MutS2
LIRDNLKEIISDYTLVLKIDSVYGLSRFADIMDMTSPEINNRQYMRIFKGKHPLLWMTLKEREREDELVALDFELGKDFTTIVITGSNAGGKTVALKTVGVIVLMALSGMHTPAGSGTTVPLLTKVLVDIGDEQSIEESLSTFSAHVTRISSIIEQSSKDSLVIIDELGTGTDPDEGGALSCAILKELKRKGTLTAVSTHLGTVKVFAYSEEEMINGAMEIETVQSQGPHAYRPIYRPTYRLKIGEAGQSHAFEIAAGLGIPETIIDEARSFIAGKGLEFEDVISELKEKSQVIETRLREAEEIKKEQERIRQSLEKEFSQIQHNKKQILSKAYEEAEDILWNTRRDARNIIDTIKSAEKKSLKKMYYEIEKKQEKVKQAHQAINPPKIRPLTEAKKGQRVILKDFGIQGIVHSFNDKTGKCKVIVNNREIEIPLSDLGEPLNKQPPQSEKTHPYHSSLDKMLQSNLSDEIKLIGQRVDPALSHLERYLNDAELSGFKQIKVIHGVGTGALARAIREYLKNHPLVNSFNPASTEEGGDGVTIVYLK